MNDGNGNSSQPERPQSLSAPVHWRTFHFLFEGILNLLRVWLLAVYHPRQLYRFLHADSDDLEVEDRILFGIKEIAITSKRHKVLGPWQYITETATTSVILFTFSISIMNAMFPAIRTQIKMETLTGINVVDGFIYGLFVTVLILAASSLSALFASMFLNNKLIIKKFMDLAAYCISTAILSVAVSVSIFTMVVVIWSGIISHAQGLLFSIVMVPTLVMYGVMIYVFVFFSVELAIRLATGATIVLRRNFEQEPWRIACMVGVVVLLAFVLFYAIGIYYR